MRPLCRTEEPEGIIVEDRTESKETEVRSQESGGRSFLRGCAGGLDMEELEDFFAEVALGEGVEGGVGIEDAGADEGFELSMEEGSEASMKVGVSRGVKDFFLRAVS
ncbi:MAG: hypothetical protein V2A58_10025 [Planctomycetota bacterium]